MKRILLSALTAAALLSPAALAAQGTASVTGRVSDSTSGQPVAGARVGIVGTGVAVLTDADGRYVLQGLAAITVTLRAQRIGFTPQTRELTLVEGVTTTVDFGLVAAATMLSDVVVTGYGTMNRENVSGAVASVRATEIANTPVAGVDAAIQGRAAGVQVVQNAGNPGTGITVRIRGSSSIAASNQPLYVIDGVPMLRDDFSQLGIGGQDITAVTGINPDEIESIDILKDASTAAIYGSRGSNGVVMITTKRGVAGAGRVTMNTYAGSQSVPKGARWDLLNGREYLEYMNEAAANDGYGSNYFGDPATLTVDTDWQEAIFRSAPVSNMTLGVSGGNDRVRYFVSGSQFRQEGVVIGSAYNRQSARVNVDLTASDKLSFRSSLTFNREDHDRIEGDNTIAGAVTNAIANPPSVPVTRSDGNFTTRVDGLSYQNSVAIGTHNFAESRGLRALGSIEAAYAFTRNVSLTGRFGLDIVNLRDLRWYSPRVGSSYAASVNGYSIIGNQTANRYLVEGYASFSPTLGPSGALSLTGGASMEWNGRELDYVEGIGFAHDQFQYPGNAATVTAYDGDWTGHNLVSVFSRANASFHDRYLFTASIRSDGSSRFGANNRYGLFPAASVAWKVTDEGFAQGLASRADLKLRASVGVTGNHDIDDDFAPLSRFAKANYGDAPGISQDNFGNPDLRWERTREYNIGLDLGLFDGRVTVLGDYYKKITDDLLLNRPISSTSGQTSVTENIGSMQNRGFELTISSQNLRAARAGGFSWTTDLNISWNRNRVTKLYNDEPITVGLYDLSRIEEGHPLAAFYTLRFIGVDPATGDAIFEDVNDDGFIDEVDDRVFIGSPHPDYWGGITNVLSWGGFDVKSFLQFTQGHMIYNAISVFALDGGYYTDNKFKRALDRWQQPGDVTDEPRASYDGTSGADRLSSRYFEDGSYIRLQEITVGYRLPDRFAAGLRLSEARLYLSGRNLHTWTKYSGYSPDVNSNGSSSNTALSTEFYAYPSARTITFGISGAF